MITHLAFLLACGPKKTEVVDVEPTTVSSRKYAQRPAPLPKKSFTPPPLETAQLSNEIPFFVQSNMEVPLVRIWLSFDAGTWTDPDDKIGLTQATIDMLDEGSVDLSGSELSQQLRNLGSSLDVQSSPDGATIQIQTLKQNLAPTLDILKTVLTSPLFPQDVWERKQKQYIQTLAQKNNDPRSISRNVWNHLLYKDQYIGRLQKEEHITAITKVEMQRWFDTYIVPENMRILVGGATSTTEIQPLIEERFGTWKQTPIEERPTPPSVKTLNEPSRSFIYLIDKPGASQSVIRIGHPIGLEKSLETMPLQIANQAIGGMFTARINQLLREEKGWTYGAWTWMSYNYLPGSFNMSSSVVTEHTAASIREVIRILRESQSSNLIKQEELDRGKGDMMGTYPLKFENPSYSINQHLRMIRYNLPKERVYDYINTVSAIDLATAQQTWNKNINPEQLYIVVVGDKKSIEASLLEIGYPIIDTDVYGKKIVPAQ